MKKVVFIRDTSSDEPGRTQEFYLAFITELRKRNLEKKIQLVRVSDLGIYGAGLAVKIFPDNYIYAPVREEDIPRIIDKSLLDNKYIRSLSYLQRPKQLRIALRNCGIVDPEDIDDYLARGGYQALAGVLREDSPEQVIAELKTSQLRGRGGAGYPTWKKWQLAQEIDSSTKYVICNADEGDPGAYMDRSILEGDPHSVMEGMMIAAFAVGSDQALFYIRAEYPLAIERVQKAIDQAYERGLLGKNILGTKFALQVEIRLGAGAFVCGEETALIASLEGKRGYPRPRPPYPSVQGLWGKPTTINNVETLANIPPIIERGGKWFSGIGTKLSKGTKVFALTGKVRHSGLIEVPMGTTLKDIVEVIGGGVQAGKKIKAVQTGGPSGGVIPEDFLDLPVGYERLQKLGSIMGSGGMIVMDEDDCMVDIAKFYLQFCVDESCGKCAPCRIGGTQMLHILTKITEGKGEEEDLDRLRKIGRTMQKASLCGLGQSAPNPVLSTLNYFAEEYQAHVREKKCPAGRCVHLFQYTIDPESCQRCGICARNCPVAAISGDRDTGWKIDPSICTRCGRCFEVCKFSAVRRS